MGLTLKGLTSKHELSQERNLPKKYAYCKTSKKRAAKTSNKVSQRFCKPILGPFGSFLP